MEAVRERLILFLPVAFFLSYLPHIYLGFTRGTNLDISVLQITLGLFVLASLPAIWRHRRQIAHHRVVQLAIVFVVISALSLLWTPNLLRGSLALGLILLIFTSLLSFLTLPNLKNLLPRLLRVFVWSAVGASLFAWYQVVGEAVGWVTFLPVNYQAELFGFARPTAFAQEPQFFASQLLAPILYLTYLLIHKKADWWQVGSLSFLVMTLTATLSRGALFALAIGVVVLLVVNFAQWRRFGKAFLLYVAAGLVSLSLLGLAASLNQSVDDNYYSAVSKSINQLSMGLIELPQIEETPKSQSIPATNKTEPPESEPVRDSGYVVASTDERMSMNQMAVETITESPTTLLFGVGLGGTGFAFAERFGCPQSCINFSQYLDVWVEVGVFGLVLLLALLGWLAKHRLITALVMAYAVQWFFFAGYPNSLPVYIALMLMVAVIAPISFKREAQTSQAT